MYERAVLDPTRSPFRFGGHHGKLDTIHQHIQFGNILFRNHGQDELFGANDLLLVALADLHANGLGGTFDGFGRNVQIGEQFQRPTACGERHLTAHHRFHASHARRGFQTVDIQLDVNRMLARGAIGAQVIRPLQLNRPKHGQHSLGAQFLVVSPVAARTGNGPVVVIRWIVAQELCERGSSRLVHGGSQGGLYRLQIEPPLVTSLVKNNA